MSSVRARLLVWLLGGVLLVGAAGSWFVYRNALVEADAFFDYHLRQTALLLSDQPVEYLLPVLVAREVVVGDEEASDPLLVVLADDLFQVVGTAEATLPTLHIDDGAERTLVGAASPEIDAGQRARRNR